MQDLINQAKGRAVDRVDGQAVVADVTSAVAVADLAQFVAQRGVAGEVEFGAIMDDEDNTVVLAHQFKGASAMRLEDGSMGDGSGVHEVVAAVEGLGVAELVGKTAAGMLADAVGELDQAARAAPIAESGLGEILLTPGGRGYSSRLHGERSSLKPVISGLCVPILYKSSS